ncbi:MAG: PAS domain S-box protein [Chitinophagaceae bacterium]
MNHATASPPLLSLAHANGMVVVVDVQGIITTANTSLQQFLSCDAAALNGKPFSQLAIADEMEKAQNFCNDVLAGIPVFGYLALQHNGASKKVVNLSMVPLMENGHIAGACCFLKDVTGTVLKNKKIHDSEQRLAAIFNNALEWLQIVLPDGTLADINPAGMALLGVDNKEELTGAPCLPFVHAEDQPAFLQMHRQVCNGHNATLQYRVQNRRQHTLWVETNCVPLRDKYGNIYATLSVSRDISEKKQAEINLHLSEQKFRSLVQNSSDLTFVIDENAYVRYVSPTVKDIAGYDPEYLLGKQALSFLHADDMALVHSELHKVKTATNSGTATAHRFLTKSGKWIWLESKGANLLHDSSVQGMVINSRDVTDRILLQQKLDQELANRQRKITAAVIQAQEAERSQLGQELHDNVNQVLTTVKLYNEMLASGMGMKDEILQKSTQYLQLCIDEIRNISKRLSAPTLGQISLTDSVHELVHSINLTNKLQIHYRFEGFELASVSQDVHLTIYRIIQEQLNNILKHANAQHVFIEISNTVQHLSLIIRDDGDGFDPNDKRRGIGITNMITRAENMNGKLHLQTAPGKGCVLAVTLPPLNICSN